MKTITENGFSVQNYPIICNFTNFYTAVPYIPPYQGGFFIYISQVNLRDGYGVQVWADGARYEGQWMNDNAHGKGTEGNGNRTLLAIRFQSYVDSIMG